MAIEWEPSTAFRDVAVGRADTTGPYRELLGKCPVAHFRADEGFELWGIFGHAEVAAAALDTKTFSSVTVPPGSPRILPLMADPPEQTAYRRLLNQFFFPPRIAAVEPAARATAVEIIDGMVAAGTADFATTYAYPFSTRVLCHFLEVEDDWEIYNDWSSEMERVTKAGMAKPGTPLPADTFQKVMPYLEKLTADKRRQSGDDVVSGIIKGEIKGQALDDQAVIGLLIALILAGRSTTASGLGNLVLRLGRDPELQQFLRANPERIRDAVEESLRIDAPQQEQPRVCTRDVEIGGQLIRSGDRVFLNFGSANVDPRHWDDPASFDIDRPDKKHFGFGKGVHQCFGAPLARMEMRVTVEELLARTRSFTVTGQVDRLTWPRLSVEHLPLTITPA